LGGDAAAQGCIETPYMATRQPSASGVNSADFISIDEATGRPSIDFTGVTRRQLAAVAGVTETEKA
jgi:hypothetical protein